MRNFTRVGLFIITLCFFHSAETRAEKLVIAPTALTLNYEDFDGSFNYPCKAARISDENPYDLSVRCYDGEKLIRTFSIHLIISRYEKPVEPRTKYEILYWVNNEGATSWLSFNEVIRMSGYQASQSIAGETSALRLKVSL